MQLASACSEEVRLRVRANDAERLAVLSQYDVVDTMGEPDFEMLVEVIKVQCDVPMAAIAFVDRERTWMKASRGFNVPEIPRLHCFCSVCMHHIAPMIVEDASLDPRFWQNALVSGGPGLRFYAGFPIFSQDGFGLGSVCAIDMKPRSLNAAQMGLMEKARDWVEACIEVRRLVAHSRWSAEGDEEAGNARELAEAREDQAWQAVRRLF